MITLNLRSATQLNLTLSGGLLILWVGYVGLSYYRVREDFRVINAARLAKTQRDVIEALNQLEQFLTITEARLLNSYKTKDKIVPILSSPLRPAASKKFPEIISLRFALSSDPETIYTRFGAASHELITGFHKKANQALGVNLLNNEIFEIKKTVAKKGEKAIGILSARFSLHSLLGSQFKENELHIVPLQSLGSEKERLFFSLKYFPYAVVLDKAPPTFWQFLNGLKIQILLALLYGISLVSLGRIFGKRGRRHLLTRSRTQIATLGKELKAEETERKALRMALEESKTLLRLMKASHKERIRLWEALQERRRHMAGQVLAILTLTERLITTQVVGHKTSKKETHEIFRESLLICKHLVNGFPMKGVEEEIDVLEELHTILEIFLPQITERNIILEIIDSRKKKGLTPPCLDKLIFEIVFHNIFYLLIDRLMDKATLKIEIRANDPLEITFYDNGYEASDQLQNTIHNHIQEDMLSLGKRRLREFMGYIGWSLTFSAGKKAMNVTTLSIPSQLKAADFSANVVNLFDFKPLLK